MRDSCRRPSFLVLLLLGLANRSLGFAPNRLVLRPLSHIGIESATPATLFSGENALLIGPKTFELKMGLFDGISSAFSNQDYKAKDQRVRASHILIKGDDVEEVLGKIKETMSELYVRVQEVEETGEGWGSITTLKPIFSELATRESQCPSGAQGGDLGLFGPGKMVKEFDAAIFPKEEGMTPPPVGSVLGPVITDFGCHVILVTEREVNKDQVEEKLARND
uniref:Peptidyl-prolyl cis-trans isomerase n=1 Tax=Chaetoceros debilis TaxID=122233 RepID=A0A7S3V404_9STRA|mmetsp:Transcript_26180/g.40035  ORF Transcript_26180/g.40035 Transcript_26180/m.40035 type:complete len:222 (+) Transcript_26180:99-764(+)|eukprot:CAMPEP_0194082832 /NCGR_PEP_ID=MMETSP0149-20130528/8249_1 /TAXON_ID=122233 /ORGANISM="Chaetoceros debilis, Strain MM31A-1" /LENGTH=221 /DNA_ID=CAMNT_0038765087 /DNA_START=34 /DNA_END=699 /DNA_ORIENTATION=-